MKTLTRNLRRARYLLAGAACAAVMTVGLPATAQTSGPEIPVAGPAAEAPLQAAADHQAVTDPAVEAVTETAAKSKTQRS
ncbi:hypothetical protein [Streptomyces fractus]|uniref:hypothetical protein n=1 Tax=Streptomyces fractus TaxID=641806 RepID=UPI003CF48332